jgi:hypothetical protein
MNTRRLQTIAKSFVQTPSMTISKIFTLSADFRLVSSQKSFVGRKDICFSTTLPIFWPDHKISGGSRQRTSTTPRDNWFHFHERLEGDSEGLI